MNKSENATNGEIHKPPVVKLLFLAVTLLFLISGTLACMDDQSEWRQLFNGKDLTGWKHAGPGYMTMENGLLRGHGGMGLLYWPGAEI